MPGSPVRRAPRTPGTRMLGSPIRRAPRTLRPLGPRHWDPPAAEPPGPWVPWDRDVGVPRMQSPQDPASPGARMGGPPAAKPPARRGPGCWGPLVTDPPRTPGCLRPGRQGPLATEPPGAQIPGIRMGGPLAADPPGPWVPRDWDTGIPWPQSPQDPGTPGTRMLRSPIRRAPRILRPLGPRWRVSRLQSPQDPGSHGSRMPVSPGCRAPRTPGLIGPGHWGPPSAELPAPRVSWDWDVGVPPGRRVPSPPPTPLPGVPSRWQPGGTSPKFAGGANGTSLPPRSRKRGEGERREGPPG